MNTANVDNGVNVEHLLGARQTLSEAPEAAPFTWKATLEGSMDILGILGGDPDVRNGFNDVKVSYDIDADATADEIRALVAQSQKRSAVYDIITNPTNVTVEVN